MLIRLIILAYFGLTGSAFAGCDWAEQAERSGRTNIALMQYMYCAEEEEDAQAQYKLGALFYKGEGLKQPDHRRSALYFSLSANNGYAPAQVKLGLLYWRGEGLSKSLKMAHKWLYLAQEPNSMRWFYHVGASSDPVAQQVFNKINAIAIPADMQIEALKGLPVSYAEVASFQHSKLLEAGQNSLNDRDYASLQSFLQNVKPDVVTKGDASIETMLKPAMLTENNFKPKQVPVLEMLQKTLDAERKRKILFP